MIQCIYICIHAYSGIGVLDLDYRKYSNLVRTKK